MHYKPSPTSIAFMASRAFVKIICGPVGGGKSTTAVMTLWTMAVQQAAHNGVRRSKFLLVRNTMAQLKSTVKPLIDQWFVEIPAHPLGQWRVVENTFEIKCRLPDGTVVHTEFVMMPADTPDDVRRLLSVEATAAWVEEAREIDEQVFSALQGRVNRFPNMAQGGVTYPCVICSTNPPPFGTYWHRIMVEPPEKYEVFFQPPALLDDGSLNPLAENLANLSPTYYENLVAGKTDDWIAVYLKNKFGAGGFGAPVFRATFRKDFHVAKSPLKPIFSSNHTIIVGSDNGLTAAAVIGQQNALGRINLLREAYVPDGESMGYDRFLETLLIPQLRELNVPPSQVLFVVDPACFQRSQANEVTIAMEIAKRGYRVVKTTTNLPERRVSAVESLLMRQVGGEAMLQFDPGMKHTIAAMDWGYRNKKQANGQSTAVPDKNHHSHIGEAVQYFCLHYANPNGDARQGARPVERRHFAYT